jgi:addiction module RelE/StbE family toxin
VDIRSTSNFKRKIKKVIDKNRGLSFIIDEKIAYLQKDPSHPGLRLHKLSGKKQEYWSISIKSNLRIIFRYTLEGILFTNIGSHDEVY